MQIVISKQKVPNPEQFIRRCGYGLTMDRRSGHKSYVKRFDRDLYPRFHVYIDDKSENWQFNLHLDQRQTVYEGATAHNGEYDGTNVEREASRIQAIKI